MKGCEEVAVRINADGGEAIAVTLDVNALGVLIGMQEAAKQMIKQGKQDFPYGAKIIRSG